MGSVGDLLAGLLFVCLLLSAAGPLLRPEAPAGAAPQAGVPEPRSVPSEAALPAQASEARGQALVQIQQELAAKGVIVRIDPRLGVLRLPEELLFEPGHADMRAGGGAKLARLAAALMYFLPHLPRVEAVLVEGHTDDRPIHGVLVDGAGQHADNWDLAYHRAKATYQGLVAAAPQLGRLNNDRGVPVLGMGAYGPARPVASNATPEGRRLNRRIDLRVVLAPDTPVPVPAAKPGAPEAP